MTPKNKTLKEAILVDLNTAKKLLPERIQNSNKGTFGKTLLITGSDSYRGAAHLSLESALRGGAGIVHFAGEKELCRELRMKFPEAIYHEVNITDVEKILELSGNMNSVLIGCGSSVSAELCNLVISLLENSEKQIILDADALNSISKYSSPEVFKTAKIKPIITPHPLEFSRLSGMTVTEIESSRQTFAESFAKKYNYILLLKGHKTVITDGDTTYINTSGNSALAKGGSGDTLAGLIASLTAFSKSPLESIALAAFVHGRAGESLGEKLSTFGTTPSDLPREMAKILAEIEKM